MVPIKVATTRQGFTPEGHVFASCGAASRPKGAERCGPRATDGSRPTRAGAASDQAISRTATAAIATTVCGGLAQAGRVCVTHAATLAAQRAGVSRGLTSGEAAVDGRRGCGLALPLLPFRRRVISSRTDT